MFKESVLLLFTDIYSHTVKKQLYVSKYNSTKGTISIQSSKLMSDPTKSNTIVILCPRIC